jgi:hypothetical protein
MTKSGTARSLFEFIPPRSIRAGAVGSGYAGLPLDRDAAPSEDFIALVSPHQEVALAAL